MKTNIVTRPNGLFQQWQSLLHNRTKRTQSGKFIIQGVRPINAAMNQQLEIDTVLYKYGAISDWAKNLLGETTEAKTYQLSVELMKTLGEKTDDTPELLLIAKIPTASLSTVKLTDLRSKFVIVLDRPQNPGNIGAVIRSADALGAAMVIIAGHSADIYDPKSIRASRGSLFALPVVKSDSPSDIQQWIVKQHTDFAIIGLSEDSDKQLWDYDLRQPTIAVIGNETWGLSKQWIDVCTNLALIPMEGSASSLNAASSAAITLYEYAKQGLITNGS